MNALRKYQKEFSDAVMREFETVDSTLGVLPTGCGKTICFADIIQRMQPARVLVLAHRKELIWQAHDKIELWTGLECDVEMADLTSNEGLFGKAPVIVGTVQTQISGPADGRRRMSRFNPQDFGLLVLDECHHSAADSYRDVINYYRQNPELKVLGVTATPDRADEEALGQILQTVAYNYELCDAIDDGWLVDIVQRQAEVIGLDYSDVRTTAGDLNGADLADVMEAEQMIQGVVQPVLETMFRLPKDKLSGIPTSEWAAYLALEPEPRRTIIFCASKRQAELTRDVMARSIGDKAAWVCDSTPPEDRASLLKDFANGKVYAVANVGILTEGYDNPAVELIAMARATKSRSLYAQMIGRSTRPLPGLVDGIEEVEGRVSAIKASPKPHAVILDFVGNCGRHKLINADDLLGGKFSDTAVERAKKLSEALDGEEIPVRQLLKRAQSEIDEEEKKRKQIEAHRRAHLQAKVNYQLKTINPFDVWDITRPARTYGWDRGKTLTEKQANLLRRQGVDPASLSYAEARIAIGEMFRRWDGGLCSLKQAKLLKRFGLETNVTREAASKLIDQLAKNNWRPLPLKLEAA